MSKDRRFCFTINNPTPQDATALGLFLTGEHVTYGVVGREVGESGTPHLQGFCILKAPQRFSFFHSKAVAGAHLEVARGSSKKASDYCKKDGDFDEYGELPAKQGRRTDIDDFKAWCEEQETCPSEREIARQFPGLFLRYKQHLLELVAHLRPLPAIGVGEPRQWQRHLEELLDEDPDDRSVNFYVDPDGGKGKSWFVRYYFTQHPDDVQVLSVGKRDDLAHAIDATKRVFIFDVPRGGMEYFQYSVVEKLKDQIIFSGKYQSATKFLEKPVHVVVFCNEFPSGDEMTADRYVYGDF